MDSQQRIVYNAMMADFQQKGAILFSLKDGTEKHGTPLVSAFWKGYHNNQPALIPPNTLIAAAYKAGKVCAKNLARE